MNSLTVKGNADLYAKYEKLKDGNAIYFDDIEDDPNISIDIEWIVQHKKESECAFLKNDF